VNLVKSLSSPSKDYDALVLVATQLDQIKEYVDSSVTKDLQLFSQVRIQISILVFLFYFI
jgi:hypothetical protein